MFTLILVFFAIAVAFLVGVDQYFVGKVRSERNADSTAVNLESIRCNEAGLLHKWEYVAPSTVLSCNRCGTSPKMGV